MNFEEYKSKTKNLPRPSFWKSLRAGSPLFKTLVKEKRLPTRFKSLLVLKDIGLYPWKLNFKAIEIDITWKCNLTCYNCSRNCGTAKTEEHMTIGQIKKFINESIKLDWKWNRIRLIGGEPTLHPNFWKIFNVIKDYKERFNKSCKIEVSSNGAGKKVKEQMSKLPKWVGESSSSIYGGKTTIENLFDTYNVAPIDLEEYKYYKEMDFEKGCWIPEWCGITLNRNGYYPCGSGGAVDRVFGFDKGIKKLSDVNKKSLRKQMRILCKFCGRFKGRFTMKVRNQINSPSWEKAFKKYKKERPELSHY